MLYGEVFVWFTLIGCGGRGDGTTGGGSGSVTNFMCPAFLIPDVLTVRVGQENVSTTQIIYTGKDSSPNTYQLLSTNSGTGSIGGAAVAANFFTAMGFYQSVAGASGTTGSVSASGTTFLSGGGAFSTTQASNYGYSSGPANTDRDGFFQMQPIIVGTGGMGGVPATGGIGCGGGQVNGSKGGNGLVVIITW